TSPTLHAAVREQPAGVVVPECQVFERASRRGGTLPQVVQAPALRVPVLRQGTGVIAPGRQFDPCPGGRVRRLDTAVAPPAMAVSIDIQTARMLLATRNLTEGDIQRHERRLVFRATSPARRDAIGAQAAVLDAPDRQRR